MNFKTNFFNLLVVLAVFTSFTQIKAEEIELNFDHFTQGPKYYNTGDWYVVLENDEDWEVYLNWIAPKDDYCGTFRTKDFDHDYSYIFTPDNRENGGIHYDNILMKINKEEITPFLSQIVLEATISGDDGNTYKIHAIHDVLNYKETIETVIMDASFMAENDAYTMIGSNDEMDIRLVVLSEEITGVFQSIESFDISSSHIVYKGNPIVPIQVSALVDVGLLEDNVLAYGAQLEVLGADTVMYKIKLASPFPEPTDTVDIVCNNLRIDDTWAAVYNSIAMQAHNDDYEIMIMYSDKLVQENQYSEADAVVQITDKNTLDQVESLITNLKLSKIPNTNDYQAEVLARCTDNKVYNMHLSWVVPEPKDTVKVVFNTSAQASYYTTDNDLLLMNKNQQYELALNVYNTPLGGTFTLDNMGAYTSLYIKDEEVDLAQVQGVVYQSYDTTWIKADIIGFDSVFYQTELWYRSPSPVDTVYINLTDVPFDNHLEEGYFHFNTYSADNKYAVSLMPATHQVSGTYINDGLFGEFGAGRYDFFNDYTYIAEWNETTQNYDLYTVEKGELFVHMDDQGYISATAHVVCENAKYYQVNITSKYERLHLDWDAESGAIERKYGAYDQLQIDDFTNEGYMVFSVTAADKSDMVVLYLFTDTPDVEIGLPEGTYIINNSCKNKTILASTGLNEDGSVSPSLYSTLDGEYLDVLYFLVDGTAEVSKNEDNQLYVDIHAVNSYDVPIHIVYDASATDIQDLPVTDNQEVQKMMIDAQLRIIRNGHMFNTLGAKIK
jgi:hypothetical protein